MSLKRKRSRRPRDVDLGAALLPVRHAGHAVKVKRRPQCASDLAARVRRWTYVHEELLRGRGLHSLARELAVAVSTVHAYAHRATPPATRTPARLGTPRQRRLMALLRALGAPLKRCRQVFAERGIRVPVRTLLALWRTHKPVRAAPRSALTQRWLPGQRLEVDLGQVKLNRLGLRPLFCACLRYSHAGYAEVLRAADADSVAAALRRALDALGVPGHVACDQGRAFVTRPGWRRPLVSAALRQLARDRGFEWRPCHPGRPNEKQSVETYVGWCQRWLIGSRKGTFWGCNSELASLELQRRRSNKVEGQSIEAAYQLERTKLG